MAKEKDYFNIVSKGYNKELQREVIQIHAGENGNIFLIKTNSGFIIDVYGQDDLIDSLQIWEDDLESDIDTLI
jgi:LEA14-like dessication related protein